MPSDVIQGFFPSGRPRLAQTPPAAPRAAPPPVRGVGPPAPAARPAAPVVQRAAGQPSGDRFAVDPAVLRRTGPGTPLPAPVRAHMEQALGADFGDVRVHVGPQAESIGAVAFTAGSDIYFAPGRFAPDSVAGRRLLGHELAHVVQQREGRVRGSGGGVTVVRDAALEAEADRAGARAGAAAAPAAIQAAAVQAAAIQAGAVQAAAVRAGAVRAGAVQPSAAVRISAPQQLGPGRWRLTATAAGREVGGLELRAGAGGSAEITGLRVAPPHRGQGIGAQLMASARQAGHGLGLSRLSVTADDDGSGRLTRWYGRQGFAQAGADPAGRAVLAARIGGAARVAQRMEALVSPRDEAGARRAEAVLRDLVQPRVANGPDVELAKSIKDRLERVIVPRIDPMYRSEIYLGAVLLPSDLSGGATHVIAGCRYVNVPRHAYRSAPKSDAFAHMVDVQSRDSGEICHLRNDLIRNTVLTLFAMGQIDYLKSAEIGGRDYGVYVELHYVRGRWKKKIGMHKDNRGDNIFVNLNYFHDQEIPGPEYIVNPALHDVHERQVEQTMNPTFRRHLKSVRQHLPAPREIGASKVPAFGVVGFVDEAIHHSTPHLGGRTVTGADLATFLASEQDGYDPETLRRLGNLTITPKTVFSRLELTCAGMSDRQIRRLFNAHARQKFNTVNLPGVHVPGRGAPEPSVTADVRAPDNPRALRRQMSALALADDLPRALEGDRSFLRTWVRAVKL